jgi:hypothetical protein
MVWEGPALIPRDRRGSHAYLHSVRQWRNRDSSEAIHRVQSELQPDTG